MFSICQSENGWMHSHWTIMTNGRECFCITYATINNYSMRDHFHRYDMNFANELTEAESKREDISTMLEMHFDLIDAERILDFFGGSKCDAISMNSSLLLSDVTGKHKIHISPCTLLALCCFDELTKNLKTKTRSGSCFCCLQWITDAVKCSTRNSHAEFHSVDTMFPKWPFCRLHTFPLLKTSFPVPSFLRLFKICVHESERKSVLMYGLKINGFLANSQTAKQFNQRSTKKMRQVEMLHWKISWNIGWTRFSCKNTRNKCCKVRESM